MVISIRAKSIVLAQNARVATSFTDRLIGLMFSKDLGDKDALIIKKCKSIHTFFMRYAIDVMFIDNKKTIVKIIRNINPFRMTLFYIKAVDVIEFKAGSISSEIHEGDTLEIVCLN